MKRSVTTEETSQDGIIAWLEQQLGNKTGCLTSGRTAKLWLQYMDVVDILRKSVKGERTGNWNLLLLTVSEMVPYMAASGHNLCAKSATIYLQQIRNLGTQHPDIQQKVEAGYHAIRRSDRFWAGLSSDLISEQVLMRSMKSSGGLTRGRGMKEKQRLTWLLSLPALC